MKFGLIKVKRAKGSVLAHGAGPFKKGRLLSAEDVALLAEQGVTEVMAAKLGPSDVPEDEAAGLLAKAIAGTGVQLQAPFTGRANAFAERPGLVVIDELLLARVNRVHEAITIATLKSHEVVAARQMLATVKIIPYAVPRKALQKVLGLLRGKKLVRVAGFQPLKTGLILTSTPRFKPALLEKAERAIRDRLAALGNELAEVRQCSHETAAVKSAIAALHNEGCTPILVFGASAIVDRADVIPLALKATGGRVIRLGMPVDPGNLLMLGQLGKVPVVGVPSCARSPKINGFDWILNRLAAGLKVSGEDVAGMGTGGLLTEISSRPQPREGGSIAPLRPRIAAIVLAAGLSSRMGSNKLLADLSGEPLIAQTVKHVAAAGVDEIIVVTGHQAHDVRQALVGTAARFVHNEHFAEGLASSVKAGVAAASGFDATFICLGDMPLVRAGDMKRMLAAFNVEEGRILIAPARGRKLGNPVLWGSDYFPELMVLTGDRGARGLLEAKRDDVVEIAVEDDSILLDADTPEALAKIRKLGV